MTVATWLPAAVAAFAALQTSQQPVPTFRAGTTLVELTVIALDGRGKPVVDLKQDEIAVVENGQPHSVAFFRFEGAAGRDTNAREALPRGLYSNRPEYAPGQSRHITAIVLDTLHTRPSDQASARRQIAQYLGSIASRTRVAVYELGWNLSAVHDFTDDVQSLRERLLTQPSGPALHSPDRDRGDVAVRGLSPEAAEMLRGAVEEMRRQDSQYTETADDRQRAAALSGLEELGRHIAGFPGLKSLVWVTTGFPTRSSNNGFLSMYDAQIRATMQRLATRGIAVYPVDARGLSAPSSLLDATGRGASRGGPPPRAQLGLPDQSFWATMDLTAAITGGRVARNTNDLADGVKLAARDAEAAYTVAFYTSDASDSAWHRVEARTTRSDVHLLTREGYMAGAADGSAAAWSDPQWQWAVSTALGSTAIHLDGRLERVAGQPNTYDALVLLVPEELAFRKRGATFSADVEMAMAQRRGSGAITLHRIATSLAMAATTDTSGTVVQYRDRWTLEPDTSSVRLIVRDRSTGRYGALDMPLAHMPSK